MSGLSGATVRFPGQAAAMSKSMAMQQQGSVSMSVTHINIENMGTGHPCGCSGIKLGAVKNWSCPSPPVLWKVGPTPHQLQCSGEHVGPAQQSMDRTAELTLLARTRMSHPEDKSLEKLVPPLVYCEVVRV